MSTFSLPSHSSKREVTGEGGLITGTNPAAFTTADPFRLWIVQVGIIIVVAQLLSLGLRRFRQPKVIAEVLGGILLGPTALGRIPGFTENIFPTVSLPYLSLVANIGLCLFLFIVGLEVDTSAVMRNARMSVIVSLAGIALPFGLGTALSVPFYHHFVDRSVHFTHFMLFTGVAYSITAFPVLCRILTELKLFDTKVGVVVASAGVGNNIIGLTLLALSVALVNASSGLTALWILLICIAFTIFLLFPVKFVMRWLARWTGSIQDGPTKSYMTIVMILLFACAFFTDSIGVNAIFGAFLAGVVVPREGGLAITITEKLEDIVSIIFLPIYFALSGLNTNLGLLNNGITWAFTIAIIVLSFAGKFGGCTIASRAAGYTWRESGTVGALMSCKGLIELIVLNVGLQAGILSPTVFSMFVLEALTLTFITTPLVTTLYPPIGEMARVAQGDERGKFDEKASVITEEQPWLHRFTVVLDKLDHIPGAMTLTQLVVPSHSTQSDITSTTTVNEARDKLKMPEVSLDALQLIELSDRTSAVMKSSSTDSLIRTDPVLGIFRRFGELNEWAVTTSLSVVPYDELARSVAEHAQRHGSHLVLLPWLPPITPTAVDTSDITPAEDSTTTKVTKADQNPFFGSAAGTKPDPTPSDMHSQFVQGVFAQSKTDVALFIDMPMSERMGPRAGASTGMHVFLPFFGGPDDRLALAFVVQLCLNPNMTATVVRMIKAEGGAHTLVTSMIRRLDTVHGQPTTEMCLQSNTADDTAWSKYTTPIHSSASDATHVENEHPALRQALARIHFLDAHTPLPLDAAIQRACALRAQEKSRRLLIVAGRSQRLAKENHHGEMKQLLETYRAGLELEGMRRTIGDVGTAMVIGGSASAVVVLQAAEVVG